MMASPGSHNHHPTGNRRPWEIATDVFGGLVVAGLLGLIAWALTGLSGFGGNSS